MRQILPYIFWPWFATSCFILLRRRVTKGSWKAMPAEDAPTDRIGFPPPPSAAEDRPFADFAESPSTPSLDDAEPAVQAAVAAAADPPSAEPPADERPSTAHDAAGGVTTATVPVARSLAEALEGIAMPCDLAPLIGSGEMHPRHVAFFTSGFEPATVGAALADEFERLGYEITPLDDQSIRAERGPNVIKARLVSEALTSEAVMHELHPSAPAGALVVELQLT